MYEGMSLRVGWLEEGEGIAQLCFDRQGEAINKLDARTLHELGEAVAAIAAEPRVRGVLVTSAKDVFIVGADITEFTATFSMEKQALAEHTERSNATFVALEDLAVPTLSVINGFALGGGLELALATSLRVMSTAAQVGLPEVTLGLFPGLGGTVRLPRVADLGTAIDWIVSGTPKRADEALRAGVVDAVSPPDALQGTALGMLRHAISGELDWRVRRARKLVARPAAADAAEAIADARARAIAASGRHQPARVAAVDLMALSSTLPRAAALAAEAHAFAEVAKTQAAGSLVQTFLNDQQLKKTRKAQAAMVRPVRQLVVVGAGIMGGGIAYANALAGVSVRMKDVSAAQLDIGIGEARKQLARLVQRGRPQAEADQVLSRITPQLDTAGFEHADMVIEAVPEQLALKHTVLSALEQAVTPEAVIASNTSSLRIDDIGEAIARPQNFVGMHFFNPVPVMRLVEVIQGTRTSDAAVSTAVRHAVAMGKVPVVVKDCPGFLVNRILTHYTRAFLQLVADGADFVQVDRALEAFGWPMGPAYLQDVVGMDTGAHVLGVISEGYPQRMPPLAHNALRLMVEHGRFGQKTGLGFYRYELDPKGKPRKSLAPDSHTLLRAVQPTGTRDFSDQEMVDRLMLPLILEAGRTLEDGVVASAAEIDMALLLGVGFPAYLGGPLRYADWLGMDAVVALSDRHAALGAAYQATAQMRRMAVEGRKYHG